MILARRLLIALAVTGCSGERKAPAAAVPADAKVLVDARVPGAAWVRGPGPTAAQVEVLAKSASLRCLLEGGVPSGEFVHDARASEIAVIGRAMVEAARRDGDSPTAAALSRVAALQAGVDDRAGLGATIEAYDRIGVGMDRIGDELRVRAGLATARSGFVDLQLIRVMATAGDRAGAAAAYERPEVRAKPQEDAFTQGRRVQALVAMGRLDEARAIVAASAPPRRHELLGGWVEVALAQRDGVAAAVAALEQSLAPAADGSGLAWNPRPALALARRTGRSDDLARLRAPMARVVAADERGLIEFLYEDALAVGDDAVAGALAARVAASSRAAYEGLYRAPLVDAIRAVPVAAKPDRWRLARLWIRHAAEGGDPAAEALLTERACGGAVAATASAGPPVPATAGAQVIAKERSPRALQPCEGVEVDLRLTVGGRVVARERLDGSCSGACDEASQREGQAQLDELQAQVDRGEASQSVTDYNFTDCLWRGTRVGRRERIGDRDVVLLVEHYVGAHDVDQDRYALATEVCGALYLSPSFGETYANDFALDQLAIAASPDGDLIVTGDREAWRGVLLRVTLPRACPGEPAVDVIDPDA